MPACLRQGRVCSSRSRDRTFASCQSRPLATSNRSSSSKRRPSSSLVFKPVGRAQGRVGVKIVDRVSWVAETLLQGDLRCIRIYVYETDETQRIAVNESWWEENWVLFKNLKHLNLRVVSGGKGLVCHFRRPGSIRAPGFSKGLDSPTVSPFYAVHNPVIVRYRLGLSIMHMVPLFLKSSMDCFEYARLLFLLRLQQLRDLP